MPVNQDGFILIWRSLYEDPLWTQVPDAWLRVALGVLGKANWKAGKWFDGKEEVSVPAGSFITSIDKLSEFCRTSRQQARDALNYLERTRFITRKRTHLYTLITVRNWGRYQGGVAPENTPRNHKRPGSDPDQTRMRPGSDPDENTNRIKEEVTSSSRNKKTTSAPVDSTDTAKPKVSCVADDDETLKPPERLRRWIERTHPRPAGDPEERTAADIVSLVTQDLNERGRELDAGFITFVRSHATGKAKNRTGLYRKLAKEYIRHLGAAEIQKHVEFSQALKIALRPIETRKCPKCGSTDPDGGVTLTESGFAFCECATEPYRAKHQARVDEDNAKLFQSRGKKAGTAA